MLRKFAVTACVFAALASPAYALGPEALTKMLGWAKAVNVYGQCGFTIDGVKLATMVAILANEDGADLSNQFYTSAYETEFNRVLTALRANPQSACDASRNWFKKFPSIMLSK